MPQTDKFQIKEYPSIGKAIKHVIVIGSEIWISTIQLVANTYQHDAHTPPNSFELYKKKIWVGKYELLLGEQLFVLISDIQ